MENHLSDAPLQPSDFGNMSQWAVLVVDMWDYHPCTPARERVNELAPKVNAFLLEARLRNALIIHAPSGTVASAYANTDARRRALAAPSTQLSRYTAMPMVWLPFDDADGGCDGGSAQNPKNPNHPWDPTGENPAIWIDPVHDAMIDDGELQVLYNLLKQYGRTRILMLGVHLNMCVLWTRNWSLTTLIGLQRAGALEQVALVRDLTDTMYNPAQAPYLNHFTATDILLKYVEDYYCPTIQSSWFLRERPPFRFQQDMRPRDEPELGNQVRIASFGVADGKRHWLYGDDIELRFVDQSANATAWFVEVIAPSIYAFSYRHPRNPLLVDLYLAGDIATKQVLPEPNVHPPLSDSAALTRSWASTRWWHVEPSPPNAVGVYRLKCCGRDPAPHRFLTNDPARGLILQDRGEGAGTYWEFMPV